MSSCSFTTLSDLQPGFCGAIPGQRRKYDPVLQAQRPGPALQRNGLEQSHNCFYSVFTGLDCVRGTYRTGPYKRVDCVCLPRVTYD